MEEEVDTHCRGCNVKLVITVKNVMTVDHCKVMGSEVSAGHSHSMDWPDWSALPTKEVVDGSYSCPQGKKPRKMKRKYPLERKKTTPKDVMSLPRYPASVG